MIQNNEYSFTMTLTTFARGDVVDSVIWLVSGREPEFSDGEYSKNAHLLSSDGFHNIFLLGIID